MVVLTILGADPQVLARGDELRDPEYNLHEAVSRVEHASFQHLELVGNARSAF